MRTKKRTADDWLREDPDLDDLMPLWVPRVETVRIECGRYWDAIRVTQAEARRAHELLGPHSGPVIANPYAQVWFFLVNCDPDEIWQPTRYARLLRAGTVIAVPQGDVRQGNDVHWAVPPGLGSTVLDDLRVALDGQRPVPRWPAPRLRGRPQQHAT